MNNLTQRERDVIQALVNLRNVDLVAEALQITKRTVHFHLQNVYKKLEYPASKRNQMRLVLDWTRYMVN